MSQTPSIGRIVHYGPRRGPHMAAIITAVHSPHCVTLITFPPNGPPMPASRIMHGDVPDANPVWAWPAYVHPPKEAAAKTVAAAKTAQVDPPAEAKTDTQSEPVAEPASPAVPVAETAPEVEPAAVAPRAASKPPSARPSRSRP